MKTIKVLIAFLAVFLSISYSNAQTIDATLDESFTGLHTVPGTYPTWSEYHIAKINGGAFDLTVDNANTGTFTWTLPSGPDVYTDLVSTTESGYYAPLFTQTSSSTELLYFIYVHYKLALYSTLLEASTGTWTDTKELTLPAGVTSVDMNVISSVANNFRAFSWNIENDDLSLIELTGSVPGNSHDIVNIDMNGKSQIKIIIKANDSGGSNYNSEDYFYIKSSGPIVYNLDGSGSYCQGTSGRTITLSNSQTGTSYQLKDGDDANVGSPLDGTDGSALEWPNITAGSYTVVATNAGGTATMNGTAVITMDPYPSKPLISGDGFVENGSNSIYTGTASDATSWAWFMSPSGLANSTPSGQTTTLSFLQTGTLTLTAQATNMCGNSEMSDGFTIKIVDISGMEAQITQLKADTTSKGIMYRGLISDLEDDKIALQNQVNQLVADTLNKGIMYRDIIADLENEKLDLQTQLATAISERDDALAANATLTTQLATVTQERDDALADVATLTTQLATVTQERDDALADVTTLTTQLATVTQERDDALADVATLTTQLATVTQERDDALAANATLTTQLATVTQERDDALADVALLQTQVSDLEQEVADLQAIIDGGMQDLLDQIDQLEADKIVLQGQVNSLTDQVATLTASNTALQDQVDDLTNQVATLTASNTSLQTQVNSLTDQVATLTASNTSLQTQVNSLTDQVATLTASNTALQDQVDDLTNQVATLTASNTSLQTQVNSLTDQVATLTASNTSLQTQVNSLTDQVATLTASNTALQDQVDDLTDQVATLTASNTALQGQVDDLTDQIATLTASNTALQVQVDDLTDQVATLTASNTALQDQVDDLTDQVATLTEQLEIYSQVYILSWEVEDVTTHIFETEIGNFSVSLYPNPSPGVVFVSCTEEVKEIKIFNLQGQLIREFIVNGFETSFTMTRADMSVGTYLVHIKTSKGNSTHRIVFQ